MIEQRMDQIAREFIFSEYLMMTDRVMKRIHTRIIRSKYPVNFFVCWLISNEKFNLFLLRNKKLLHFVEKFESKDPKFEIYEGRVQTSKFVKAILSTYKRRQCVM